MKLIVMPGSDDVGADESDFARLLPNADLVIYDYQVGDWEGSGELIAHTPDGWIYSYLGHCSCYGPLEELERDAAGAKFTLEQLAKIHDLKDILALVPEVYLGKS